jgi:hypothetical protein
MILLKILCLKLWNSLPEPLKRPKSVFVYFRTLSGLSRTGIDNLKTWHLRGYNSPSPAFIKHNVLLKWGGCGTWIESGTYMGETTFFLTKHAQKIITIEPQEKYALDAKLRFHDFDKVTVIHGLSENVTDDLIASLEPEMQDDVSFWLDGHFSADETFKGPIDTPIVAELEAITKNFSSFQKITVLVDDIRCFGSNSMNYSDYPSLNFLVDWARLHNLYWTIEHDIFIASNRERQ